MGVYYNNIGCLISFKDIEFSRNPCLGYFILRNDKKYSFKISFEYIFKINFILIIIYVVLTEILFVATIVIDTHYTITGRGEQNVSTFTIDFYIEGFRSAKCSSIFYFIKNPFLLYIVLL